MKTRVTGAIIVGVLLLPAAASAQRPGAANGRPAVIAPRPASEPAPAFAARPGPAPRTDLFRARPWTYKPRFDHAPRARFPRHLFFPGAFGFASPVYAPGAPWPDPPRQEEQSDGRRPAAYTGPDARIPRLDPYVPGSAGPAKTLYVVQGCYAGDVPPRPDDLPRGCEAGAVRIIPPRQR